MRQPFASHKSGPLSGRVPVPGDKSISHRALILGALSMGTSRIVGLLQAEDVMATAAALVQLGATVRNQKHEWFVTGRGVGGLLEPDAMLDFGNSGTGARLLMGAVAGHDMTATFSGDASLSARPMGRVLQPLELMGLNLKQPRETLPLTLIGTSDLIPIEYRLPVPSAQVKSAVLLAGIHAPGQTTVIEPEPARDHTERMLAFLGATVTIGERDGERAVTVDGDAELVAREIVVPGDPSSAAFLVTAALLCPGSDVLIENVLSNPTRTGFYRCLGEMGADIALEGEHEVSGEPAADIRARAGALHGITVPAERAPSMIDEYPCLAVVAAFARGETRMEGLAELRVKESDRLASIADGLSACGVTVRIEGDALIVTGTGQVPGGATVKTKMDHRIAMAFLTLGLGAEQPVTIDDAQTIATSFPGFTELMGTLGADLRAVAAGAP
jgi:3-phosphoshikimate 1-carboxyvinyltransferase